MLEVGSPSVGYTRCRIRRHSLLPASCAAPPRAFTAVGLSRAESGRAGTTLASKEGEEIGQWSGRNDPGRRECSSALCLGGKKSGSTLIQSPSGFSRSFPGGAHLGAARPQHPIEPVSLDGQSSECPERHEPAVVSAEPIQVAYRSLAVKAQRSFLPP